MEKEIKKLENEEVERVSGGQLIDKGSKLCVPKYDVPPGHSVSYYKAFCDKCHKLFEKRLVTGPLYSMVRTPGGICDKCRQDKQSILVEPNKDNQ